MPQDINNDGALSWQARIDTSELAKDVQSIAELFKAIGEDVDISAIEAILKEQAEREVDLRKNVAAQVIQINEDVSAQAVNATEKVYKDAKQKADDIQKYIESIPFEIKSGAEKTLSQTEIDAINAGNTGTPITNRSPVSQTVNKPAFSAFADSDAINQARDAYAGADEITKQYFDDLVSLEFQLKNIKQAQNNLNIEFKNGNVTEQEYLTKSAELKSAIAGVNTELTATNNAQVTYTKGLNGEGQATEKNISILTEYRNLRNQIASDRTIGIINPEDIERAGQLKNAIQNVNSELTLEASNTAFVDAAVQGVSGLVGAFSALSGVVGLFTENNDAANKIMQDTIGFLGIIQGLEQISQTLATDGKLNQYLNGLIRKKQVIDAGSKSQEINNALTKDGTIAQEINNTVNKTDIVTKEGQQVATSGATKAQKGLNTAMELNPAGILILAITAIISIYEAFADSADKATEAQEKLNEVLDFNKNFSDDTINSMKQRGAVTIALMKAQGASEFAIREEEKKQLQTQLAQFDEDNKAAIIEGEKAAAKYDEFAKNANGKGFKEKKSVTEFSQSGAANTYDVYDDVDEKRLEELKKTKEKGLAIQRERDALESQLNIKRYDNITANYAEQKKVDDKALEDQNKANNDAKKAHDKALAGDAEYWQAKVELAQKGSKEWLDAQLKLNQSQYNKAIESGTNPDKAKADKTVADNSANKTFDLQEIQDVQDIVSARLTEVAKGSQAELALRLQLLQKEKQAAVINAEGNAAAIEKINSESLKKQSDLKKDYAATDAETFQSIQQNQLKIILAGLTEGSEEYNRFSKEAENQSAAASATSAIKNAASKNPLIDATEISLSSVFDEKSALAFADRIEAVDKDLAVKIRAIYSQLAAQKQQIDNKEIENLINNKNKIIDINADIAKEANNAIINNENSTDTQKASAQENNNNIDIDATQQKLDLSDPKSDIFKAFDKIKDPAIQSELEGDLNKMHGFREEAEKFKRIKLDAFLKDIAQFGSFITQAGEDLKDMNEGLGDTISSMGDLVSVSVQLIQTAIEIKAGFEAIKTGVDETGKALTALDYASVVLAVITTVIRAVSAVVKLFSQAKKSAEESEQKMHEYQTGLIVGQIKYNEELIESKKIQDELTKGTLDQLNAQIQLNNEKKEGYQTDLDSLTQLLATQGEYISGQHKEKYGGFAGIGRKTKVVQEFSDLGVTTDMTNEQIAAILKEKETLNQLTGDTKVFADKWLQVYDNISQANDASIELKQQLTEAFAATTADDIAKGIVDGLKKGKVAAAQWGDDFNKIISNSLLASITNTLESGEVAKIFSTLQANIQPDGSVTPLSPQEIETLKQQYADAVNQGNALLQQAKAIFPDLASTLSGSNNLSGAIQSSLTEDTGNELAGIIRASLDTAKQSLDVATNSLMVQQMIEANTAQSLLLFSNHLPMLTRFLPYLKNINDNTSPKQIKRDFGL